MSKETMESVEVRVNSQARAKYARFKKAWIACGCPKNFKWNSLTNRRIMTKEARKEQLEFMQLSPNMQKKIVEQRRAEYELKEQRKAIKAGL